MLTVCWKVNRSKWLSLMFCTILFSSVQFRCSCSESCLTLIPHGLQHTRLPCPSPTPEFTQTHVHWVSDAIQSSHPLSSPSPPALNLSQHQGLFQWVRSLHQVAKVLELQQWSFQWIFRTDILQDRLVRSPCSPRTLRCLLQHHSSKASILRRSAFFIVPPSHPSMTTGKTIALIRWTFVGKVISLLFNTLSRFVMAFLPRDKCLLI